MLLGELRPGERQDEDRVVARPVEQVVEEVQQPGICPLHVLEDEHDRVDLREALEQDAPRREQVLLVAGDSLLEPEQVGEPRLDPRALLGVGDVLGQCCPELAERGAGFFVFGDAAAHPVPGVRPRSHGRAP
jgi:hypothetical protein